MPQNIHKLERVLRVVVGIALISMAFIGPKNIWFLVGALPLLTGILGWCPPYSLLGISTCELKKKT